MDMLAFQRMNKTNTGEALTKFRVPEQNIIIDKASGKDTERERYQYLKRQITRKGDTLVIKEPDRLSRNNADIKRELEEFEEIINVKTRDISTSLTDFPSEQAGVMAEVRCEKACGSYARAWYLQVILLQAIQQNIDKFLHFRETQFIEYYGV